MPNWCMNRAVISSNDKAKMDWLMQGISGQFFEHIIPTPKDENSYNYRVSNWGTKWDVDVEVVNAHIDSTGGYVEIRFESAWSPPSGIYEVLGMMGFTVRAEYFEDGMGFGGIFQTEHGYLSNIHSDDIVNPDDEVRQLIIESFDIDYFYQDNGEE